MIWFLRSLLFRSKKYILSYFYFHLILTNCIIAVSQIDISILFLFVLAPCRTAQASLGELQPSIDTSIPAHDYVLRRQKLQVRFYLSGPRFYHAGKSLELKCVAEIENFPELKRETSLTAAITHYDNLNNQMLIHAGSGASGATTGKYLKYSKGGYCKSGITKRE